MFEISSPPSLSVEEMGNDKIKIAVVGVGGGGCNTVNRIFNLGIKSAKTIAVNTDKSHLNILNCDQKVLIGGSVTRGLGAGGFPEVGQKCAEISKEEIAKAIDGYNLVFLASGMGGGTGTGASPIVAKMAKASGALVIGIVTFPFKLERARMKKARWGINELRKYCDTVIVIDNNRLVNYAPNLPMNKAFELVDMITAKAVKGISDTIMFPSLMNIDFADVKSVMEQGGLAMISIGKATGYDKLDEAVKNTLKHPLLDVEYAGAKGALVHIAGGHKLSLGDTIKLGENLTWEFDQQANIKLGARLDDSYDDSIEVILIATGVKSALIEGSEEQADASKAHAQPAQVKENFLEEFSFV